MKTEKTLILGREDMCRTRFKIKFEDVNFYNFNISKDIFLKNSIILFIDDNGKTKLLKNRYGSL